MKASALAAVDDNVVRLRTRSPVLGLHILAEWYGCPRSNAIKRADHLRQVSLQLMREAGFDVVSSVFEQFQPGGVVGTVVLADAHMSIHTWPETGFVAIDFYACHLSEVNRGRSLRFLARLREVLRPVWVNTTELKRGVPDGPTPDPIA
jgi:S-adenosylmethionine decarboxylase